MPLSRSENEQVRRFTWCDVAIGAGDDGHGHGALDSLGHAEINHARLHARVEQDVVRLEVAVCNSRPTIMVQVAHALRDAHGDPMPCVPIQPRLGLAHGLGDPGAPPEQPDDVAVEVAEHLHLVEHPLDAISVLLLSLWSCLLL